MDRELLKREFFANPDYFVDFFIAFTERIAALEKQVTVLQEENQVLRSQLSQNSSNCT